MVADIDRERSRLDQVRNFCADTTAHGLARIVAAKSWPARLFWIAIFISASIFSVIQIYRSVGAYFSFPTKTTVSLVNKEQLMFPAVTVCNINPFKQSAVRNTSLWEDVMEVSAEIEDFDQDRPREAFKDSLLVDILSEHKEDAWKLGHQGEELITLCQFPGNQQHLRCSHKNFSHFFDMVYGNCFTFNASNTIITQPGHRQGFKLLIFIDADEYIGLLADSVGALIALHSPYVKPDLDENSIFVAPGSAVFVSLQAVNTTLLDYPYNGEKCRSNISYSQMDCLRSCVANEMKKKCGCVSVVMRQQPVCDSLNKNQVKCLELVEHNQDSLECPCDPSCNRMYFIQTVSNSAWPSKAHMPQLLGLLNKTINKAGKTVKDLESARDNMAQVNIHFASMAVQGIKQEKAITEESLLGNIGGQLGLFIGISCITIVEFLDLLWRLILPRKKTIPNQVRAEQQ